MKKSILLLLGICYALSLPAQPKTGEEQVAAELLLEDLDTLEYWISEAHGDPYRFTSPDSLNKRFTEARRKVKSTSGMTGMDFMGLVMPIMAELRDGHSQVFRPNLDRLYGKIILPVQLLFVDEKPFIRRNLSDKKGMEGAALLAINDMPMEELIDKLMPLIHRDGNIKSSRYMRMQNPVYLSTLLRVTGLSAEEYKLDFRLGNELITKSVTALNHADYKDRVSKLINPKRAAAPIKLSFIGEGKSKAAYLQISSFNPSYYQNSQSYFEEQFDSRMKEIAVEGAKSLVLDLRGNTGGEDTYVQYVLSYFLKEPFFLCGKLTARKNNYKFLPDGHHWDIDPRAFAKNEEGSYDLTRYIWPGLAHTGIDETKPHVNAYNGKLYVLINGATFSAAAELASMLHHYKRATFLGEETGGSAIGTVAGYTPTMDLKHSGLSVNISLFSTKRTFFDTDWTDKGVLPDVRVFPTIADLAAGNDPVLNETLTLIRSSAN
jgi:hypothetical protein